jgi:hypothetical protein
MRAMVGDTLHIRGRVVGQGEQVAEIIEVLGADGGPPYRVRYGDDHETLVYPGPDAILEPRSE